MTSSRLLEIAAWGISLCMIAGCEPFRLNAPMGDTKPSAEKGAAEKPSAEKAKPVAAPAAKVDWGPLLAKGKQALEGFKAGVEGDDWAQVFASELSLGEAYVGVAAKFGDPRAADAGYDTAYAAADEWYETIRFAHNMREKMLKDKDEADRKIAAAGPVPPEKKGELDDVLGKLTVVDQLLEKHRADFARLDPQVDAAHVKLRDWRIARDAAPLTTPTAPQPAGKVDWEPLKAKGNRFVQEFIEARDAGDFVKLFDAEMGIMETYIEVASIFDDPQTNDEEFDRAHLATEQIHAEIQKARIARHRIQNRKADPLAPMPPDDKSFEVVDRELARRRDAFARLDSQVDAAHQKLSDWRKARDAAPRARQPEPAPPNPGGKVDFKPLFVRGLDILGELDGALKQQDQAKIFAAEKKLCEVYLEIAARFNDPTTSDINYDAASIMAAKFSQAINISRNIRRQAQLDPSEAEGWTRLDAAVDAARKKHFEWSSARQK